MKALGAFEKAKQYIESRSKIIEDSKCRHTTLKAGPCITISRETGAGSGQVCDELLRYFQQNDPQTGDLWTVFDKNLIEKVLEDHNLPLELSKFLTDFKTSTIRSMMHELLGLHPDTWTIVQKTTQTIFQLGEMGHVIIVGRAGNIITSELKNSFHVRLVAPLGDRIKHIRQYYNLDQKEASEFIKKEDAQRGKYLMTYYKKRIDDPLHYHLVINTHLINFEQAARIIGAEVLRRYMLQNAQ